MHDWPSCSPGLSPIKMSEESNTKFKDFYTLKCIKLFTGYSLVNNWNKALVFIGNYIFQPLYLLYVHIYIYLYSIQTI